jgi:hypothetical protein
VANKNMVFKCRQAAILLNPDDSRLNPRARLSIPVL